MIKKGIFLSTAVLVLVIFSSCSPEGVKKDGPKKGKKSEVVAKVGSADIYKQDLKGRNIDDYINEEIYYQEGLKQGIDVEIEETVENFRRNNIVARVKSSVIDEYFKENPLTEETVSEYFAKNKNDYYKLTVTKVESTDAEALDSARQKVADGSSIDSVKSETVSVYKVKTPVKDFNDLVTNYEVGEVSQVGKSGIKSYFVVVEEVKEPNETLVKNSIHRQLEAARKRAALNQYMETMKQEYNIEVVN
ncbi:MAG: hypothetical protein ACR2NW_02625 [Thermodesulfobacteriota bacterium]